MGRAVKSPGALFVNLLGGFHAAGPQPETLLSFERRKTRALLAVVALDPGRMVARDKLTALLWDEASGDVARHGLRQCLLDLRRALAKARLDALRADTDLIGLDASKVVADVVRFERHVARGTPAALEEALALYRGDLLEDFGLEERAFEEWLRVERERLRSQAILALRKLLAHYVREKATDAAVATAARLLTLEPFDETVHRTLMRLYADSGRRSAALRQYEECVELLGRELGTAPERETRELYRQLVVERTRPTTAAVAVREPRKPATQAARACGVIPSGGGAPLIGRTAELEWLDGLCERARRGQPTLALVVGEAGIGKTRLVGELAARVQHHRAEVLVGRGRDGEDVLPFAPWVEALRPVLTDALLARLAVVVRRDLARLVPEIAEGPVPPSTGIEEGPRIFEAVAQVLRELAAGRLLVVAIEDLHWCDDMTLRLLRFLPRRLDGRRVLLVGTARPEAMGDRSPRGTLLDALCFDASWASRTLGPLSRNEASALFRALLPPRNDEPPPALAERVWTLSEGNPFVVLECARAVRERGAASTTLELPAQVRALTERALADLREGAARLADVAAVIGRDFDVALLKEAAGATEAELADGVEELVRRRVLREVGGRFDFSHDRVREVVYLRLLGPRRALLHRHVARALETVYAGEIDAHCAALGAHFRHAGAWAEACRYSERAGYQAAARGAGREAVACFEDALGALARLPGTEEWHALAVRVRMETNGALLATGHFEAGRKHLHQAEELAEALTDRRWAGRVGAHLSVSYRLAGRLDLALLFGQRAVDIGRHTEDRRLESTGGLALGQREHAAGNLRRALELLATVLSKDARDPGVHRSMFAMAPFALARYWMVLCHLALGEFDTAARLVEESSQESETLQEAFDTPRLLAHMSRGNLRLQIGDIATALRAYEAAYAVHRDDAHRSWYPQIAANLGLACALSGRVAEGLALIEKAETVAEETGHICYRPARLLCLARALIQAGRVDEAARVAERALGLAREHGERPAEAVARSVLAEVAGRLGPDARVEHELREALALAEALEMRPLKARCHLRLARLYKRADYRMYRRHRSTAELLMQQMGRHIRLRAADPEALA